MGGRIASKPTANDKADINVLIGDLEALSQSTKPAESATLEESIVLVAENLKKVPASPIRHANAAATHQEGPIVQRSRAASTSAAEQMTGKHTAAIGNELSKLAVACKQGQRQQFLISARSIAGVVRALSIGTQITHPSRPWR